MPQRLGPDEWKPVGVLELEAAVEEAVRATVNAVVVAGPGAGKTELLSQRACYLLQTDLCPAPRRILAISFKRDAARNLSDRVAKRCDPELARRFDSMTYDAFAKSLVDRFSRALPPRWRPSDDYIVDFSIEEDKAGDIVSSIPSRSGLTPAEIASIASQAFYRNQFVGMLPIDAMPTTVEERASLALWGLYLRGRKPSTLNFEMIDRLADLLLRANPKIVRALRYTYSFAFLDEFQDTTAIQYDLIKTAFIGSPVILTAVGDNKQRIMGWAYAVRNIFDRYQEDFKAQLIRPVRNYRSAPELVRIQQFMAKALDKKNEPAVAIDDGKDGEGECRVFVYPNHLAESAHLAELIEKWIKTDGVDPRDICVLVRKKPLNYTTSLIARLAKRSIKARVESDLQNLLSEPITTALLDFFKLASARRAPESWAALMGLLDDIGGDDSEEGAREQERRLAGFMRHFRSLLKAAEKTEPAVLKLVVEILSFLNAKAFITLYPQYAQGKFFKDTVKSFAKHLAASRAEHEWPKAIEDFEGKGSVPIMTMHKSKGLEYHTIIFVGLEDSALHDFSKHQYDEACGFFVALSRAKKRAVFTFSEQRASSPNNPSKAQNRSEIKVLYDILESAGVKPEKIGYPTP
jgi:DNA helicase II / ATP-dependent DNA helicase PcrA